ncbi:MAG: hypothetical protein AUJ92_17590 [Armatimonadetes bacterium CG2_30_59_28]|nr:mannose-1-phosphate guanylyltransferase [Armatimonadota bacterium]OIO90899.1 MAG: hypothetical protein AUJ92_17590 [Armatimonadetes bacterium CG2_30_59_28]PIU64175.1 MAG: hypothetical protein COS85_13380 [Armatimonadetes bacterium CG07_land_8_20_14_0_80_59_28]PIX40892.1 MAG: hypothetical protein COZ56_13440 [Armatimonadetes bacterium CG_4_8_14_3_um_filter_58_9]PIY48084.1 MAG: hypothetical protein COZ05_04070 [Armatimonadetes bacterium CG_4_10_14_3_um_filter_59_10]PJB74027.1 MAG: hypothetica
MRIGVVMAGGSGERFWPLSRLKRPKQLLRLASDRRNLLEEALDRLLPLIPPDRLFLATNKVLHNAVMEYRLSIPSENVLTEPFKRNTAGCLAYVSACCLHRFGDSAPDITLAITTADHRIGDDDEFRRTILTALEAVEREDCLGIVGIKPTRPETGFGYIEIPRGAIPNHGASGAPQVYRVERFREKPNRETAEDFIATGRFYWNSGMFFWKLGTFLFELGRVNPEIVRSIHEMAAALSRGDDQALQNAFEQMDDISIDFALMEHTRNVVMVEGDFPWDDLGSWDSLDRSRPHDDKGNVVFGDPVLIDAEGCIVYNEAGAEKMAVAAIGVEELVIVVAEDAVLVAPKGRVQDVRQAVSELRKRAAKQI